MSHEFKDAEYLFASHSWKIGEKLVQSVAGLEVVKQMRYWYTRTGEARHAAHFLRINFDEIFSVHDPFLGAQIITKAGTLVS